MLLVSWMWGWVWVDQWWCVALTPRHQSMAEDGGTMREPWGNHEGTLNLVLIGTCITNQFIWECVIAIKANWRSFKDPHNRGNDLSIMILVSPILKAFFRIPNCECASKVGFSFDHSKLPLFGGIRLLFWPY